MNLIRSNCRKITNYLKIGQKSNFFSISSKGLNPPQNSNLIKSLNQTIVPIRPRSLDYSTSQKIAKMNLDREMQSVINTKIYHFALYFRGLNFTIKNFEMNDKIIDKLENGNTLFKTKILSKNDKNYTMSLCANINDKGKIIERGIYFLKNIGLIETNEFKFEITYNENTKTYHVFNEGYIPLTYMLYLRDVFEFDDFIATEINDSPEVITKPFDKHNLNEKELENKIQIMESINNKWNSFDSNKQKELLLDFYGYCLRPINIINNDRTFRAIDGSRLDFDKTYSNRFKPFVEKFSKTKHSLCNSLGTLFACEGGLAFYIECPFESFFCCNDLYPSSRGEYRGTQLCSKGYTPLWLSSAICDAMVDFNVSGCKLQIYS